MEHLESFEAAATSLGRDPKILPGIEGLDPQDAKATIAQFKLNILSKAAWKMAEKKLNWKDRSQYKYYNWFNFNSSGSPLGFSYGGYDYERSLSGVGSRLVFPNSETCRYVAEKHLELYRDFMVEEE